MIPFEKFIETYEDVLFDTLDTSCNDIKFYEMIARDCGKPDLEFITSALDNASSEEDADMVVMSVIKNEYMKNSEAWNWLLAKLEKSLDDLYDKEEEERLEFEKASYFGY